MLEINSNDENSDAFKGFSEPARTPIIKMLDMTHRVINFEYIGAE
jgi:hypothetical protein